MEHSTIFADQQWDLLSSLSSHHHHHQQQQQISLTAAASTIGDHQLDFQSQNISMLQESYNYKVNCYGERPRKIPKNISWGAKLCEPNNSAIDLIPKEEEMPVGSIGWRSYDQTVNKVGLNGDDDGQGMLKRSSTALIRTLHAHEDHIVAERKRREKLSQRFIALASIIPGLKKADKASILGEAMKYVKELEQTVHLLQDQKVKETVESVVLVNKSDDDDGNPRGKHSPPEVQVKMSEKTVLVRVHCEAEKGVLVKVLSELEKLHLIITNASALPFAGSFVNITVTAQTEEGFFMTAKELAEEIQCVVRRVAGTWA